MPSCARGRQPVFWGNEARERARPWLQASTIVLLVVCLLAAFALTWGFNTFSGDYQTQFIDPAVMLPLTELDVVIEVLITARHPLDRPGGYGV